MTVVVKKYSNRRLYDTDESRYITLDELAAKIRGGTDVRIVDAKTNDDLTQATLAQLILEGPAARMLPVPLLTQMLRMQGDALGEFFSQYVTRALALYLAAKRGAQAASPFFPMATMPFDATAALARMFAGQVGWSEPGPAPPQEPPPPQAAPEGVAELRREIDELREELRRSRKRP